MSATTQPESGTDSHDEQTVDSWFHAWERFCPAKLGWPFDPFDPDRPSDCAARDYAEAKEQLRGATSKLAALGERLGVDTTALFDASGDLDGASDATLDRMWSTAKRIRARFDARRGGITPDSVSIVADSVTVRAATASVTGDVVHMAGSAPETRSESATSGMPQAQTSAKVDPPTPSGLPAHRPVPSRSKRSGRGKGAAAKWRQAQHRMHRQLSNGTLPASVRRAAAMLGTTFSTTLVAARRSNLLADHFNIDYEPPPGGPRDVLDELAEQADARTQHYIARLSARERERLESDLRDMPPKNRIDLVRTMATDPEAGRAAHRRLIEDADLDSRRK